LAILITKIVINQKLYIMFKNFIIGQMLKSKKFWYAVVGCLTTLLSDNFGLDAAQTQNILYSVIALILGQGIADLGKGAK